MPVGELQQRIDAREFTEWIAYWNVEPWGEERADLRAGIIAATVANCAPFRKSQRPFAPSEFMPFAKAEAQRQSAKEIEMRLAAYKEAHNMALRERKN